jgi:hypothetical protein
MTEYIPWLFYAGIAVVLALGVWQVIQAILWGYDYPDVEEDE